MKVSVVICTLNRPALIKKCLASVFDQSRKLDEVIIVDASDQEDENLKNDSRIVYIRSKPEVSYQRNIGVKNSSGDVILFLDDDTILYRDFVEEIIKVFEKDGGKKIGGVMGNIVNAKVSGPALKRFSYAVHLLIQRLFLLPTFGDGHFQLSGCPTYPYGFKQTKLVEFLPSGITAYRREVFQDFMFLENTYPSEDDDFSFRVSRKYFNVYVPYARIMHHASPVARLNSFYRSEMWIESRYKFFQSCFPQDMKHKLAFWWSIVGEFLRRILSIDKQGIEGLIVGINNFKALRLGKRALVDRVTDREVLAGVL